MPGESEVYQQAQETYGETVQHNRWIYGWMAQALAATGKHPLILTDMQFRLVEMDQWLKVSVDAMNWFDLTLHNIAGIQLGSQCMTACEHVYNQIVAIEPQRDLPTYIQMVDIYDRRGTPGLMQYYDLDLARAEYIARMIVARLPEGEVS